MKRRRFYSVTSRRQINRQFNLPFSAHDVQCALGLATAALKTLSPEVQFAAFVNISVTSVNNVHVIGQAMPHNNRDTVQVSEAYNYDAAGCYVSVKGCERVARLPTLLPV